MKTAVKIDFAALGEEISEEMLPITEKNPEWYKTNILCKVICEKLRKYGLDSSNKELKKQAREAFMKDLKKRQKKKTSTKEVHHVKEKSVFGISEDQVRAEARRMASQRGENPNNPLYQ